jgi:membrane associated rhomboid family serine protease
VLPLKDNIPTLRRPVVTWLLLLVNVAVFLATVTAPDTTLPDYDAGTPVPVSGFDAVTLEYGFTPCELTERCEADDRGQVLVAGTEQDVEAVRVPEVPVVLTLLTSMFMHGGLLHLGGNLLFLYIFGNNVEDAMGRLRFVLFYLVSGGAASLLQWAIGPTSDIPNIGASGAIAGVLGAYLVLFPRARVLTALTLLIFFYVVEIPAIIVLGLWFVLQLASGSAALVGPEQGGGGVAYFAHVGGFVAGLVLVRLFARRPPGGGRPVHAR